MLLRSRRSKGWDPVYGAHRDAAAMCGNKAAIESRGARNRRSEALLADDAVEQAGAFSVVLRLSWRMWRSR